MDIISYSETETEQQFQDILNDKESHAISGAPLMPTVWQSFGEALQDNATGYFLVIALDAYRKSTLTEAKDHHLSDFGADIRRHVRITTSHLIDLAYIDYASNGRLTELRETFRRCLGIFLVLTDPDLGCTALAHWEWIQACVIGKSPVAHYIVPTSYLTKRLITWLEKHGVKSLHVVSRESGEAASHKTENHADRHPHKLLFSALQKYRGLTHDALISHYHYNSMKQAAESIHRRHATAHAYYAQGERRPPFTAHDTAFCCFPAIDDIERVSWKTYLAVSPDSSSAWKTGAYAVSAEESGMLCTSPENLLSADAMLSVDAASDDFDFLAPGHVSRTLVGTYILYTRLYFGLPLPSPLAPELGSFVPPLIQALLSYWKSAGLVGILPSGCCGLTESGAQVFATPSDVLKCGGQWIRSNQILHVLPDQTPLGIVHELLTRWIDTGTYAFDDVIYAPASQEWSELGTNVLYSAKAPERRAWIDATNCLLSAQETSWLRTQLLADNVDFSHIDADKTTRECLLGVFEMNADIVSPDNSIIEIHDGVAKWWTFGGAILNAVLCTLLRCDARVKSCAFGNCAIVVAFAEALDNAEIAAILRQSLSRTDPLDDAAADDLAKNWFWPHSSRRWLNLVGPKWQRGYLRHVLSRLSPKLMALSPISCVSVDAFHSFMETTDPIFTAQNQSCTTTAEDTSHKNKMTNDTDSSNPPGASANTDISATVQHNATTPPTKMDYYHLKRGDGSMMHTHLPWSMIQRETDYRRAIDHILQEPFIGLDVETTLFDHQLCLVQIGCHDQTFLIDPFCVDVHALDVVFANPNIIKIIHNKSFECSVLGRLGMPIHNIIDTLKVSRSVHPHEKCHKLMEVCRREFNYTMDKTNQQSRWERRPLSDDQLEYAALDAEIMIHLYCHFFGFPR